MITNGFLTNGVGCVITRYLDRSSVNKKVEVMGRPLVTKTHALIATCVYACKMVFLTRRSLLGHRAQGQEAKCQGKKEVNKFHAMRKGSLYYTTKAMETAYDVNAKELMESVVSFVRSFGLHRPEQTPCGQPVPVAEAYALMDLAAFGPMRQGELASRLQLEKSTVSRLIRQMEADGRIQRRYDRQDGRAILIRLTRQGRETATQMAQARQEKFARILSAIPEGKRSMVVKAISILEGACS